MARAPGPTRIQVSGDGKSVAVERFAGGHARADVVTVTLGADALSRKHIATVRFAEMALELGVAHAQPWLDWANSFMGNSHLRKTGSVAFANASNEVRSYL